MAIGNDELLASHEEHSRCQFPRLGATPSEGKCLRHNLDGPIGKSLKEACTQYETSLDFVLGAIWAIILHQYIQDDYVGFAVVRRGRTGEAEAEFTDSAERSYSWRTPIHWEIAIGELMKPSAWKRSPYARGVDLFNTSLVIEEEQQQEQTNPGPYVIREVRWLSRDWREDLLIIRMVAAVSDQSLGGMLARFPSDILGLLLQLPSSHLRQGFGQFHSAMCQWDIKLS
jgi:hypothetical protein